MTNRFPLWPLKLHYFLMGAGAAPILPFLPVIAKQMGIPGSGVGFILALVQISGLIIKPSFGYFMDKYPSKKKSLLQLMMLVAMILLNCLKHTGPSNSNYEKSINLTQCQPHIKGVTDNSMPLVDQCLKHKLHSYYNFEHKCKLDCEKSLILDTTFDGSSVSIENEHIVFNLVQPIESAEKSCFQYDKCAIDCSNEELNSVLNTVQNGEDGYYQSISFWWIFFFWVVGATAWNGVATLQDAIATQSVQDHYSGETFGHQRLWGSVGWGCTALTVGYMVDNASADKLLFDYSPAFKAMTILWILDILVIGKLSIPSAPKSLSTSLNQDMSQRMFDVKILLFLIYASIIGIFLGSLTQEFILLEELGNRSDCNGAQAMKFLQGLVLAINCTAETPMFLYSGRIIKKFGTTQVMNSILFLFALRMFFYGHMISPWQVVLFEWIHGPIVGLFYPIMTSTAFKISPEGLTTTTTAIAYFMEGLGIAIGSWIAGGLVQFIGASATFKLFGWFASFMFVFHYTIQKAL